MATESCGGRDGREVAQLFYQGWLWERDEAEIGILQFGDQGGDVARQVFGERRGGGAVAPAFVWMEVAA